jgi:hypothetical protein
VHFQYDTNTGPGIGSAIVDLRDGSVTKAPTYGTLSVEDVGNGWYRISHLHTYTGDGTVLWAIGITDSPTNPDVHGVGTIYVTGAEVIDVDSIETAPALYYRRSTSATNKTAESLYYVNTSNWTAVDGTARILAETLIPYDAIGGGNASHLTNCVVCTLNDGGSTSEYLQLDFTSSNYPRGAAYQTSRTNNIVSLSDSSLSNADVSETLDFRLSSAQVYITDGTTNATVTTGDPSTYAQPGGIDRIYPKRFVKTIKVYRST